MRIAKATWLLLGLGACDPATPAPVAAPAPLKAAPIVAPAPIEAPVVTPPASPVAVIEAPLAGVGPGGAQGRTARRQAVLELLSDGHSAAGLALAATEHGGKFDPELAETLTPPPVLVKRPYSYAPTIRQGKPKVKGPLEPDIVRRIVRAHINELRYCYNRGLVGDPQLAGGVVVDFQIRATGMVGESKLTSTTLSDQTVGECVVEATKRWQFPRPSRAVVVDVTYPFEFAPTG